MDMMEEKDSLAYVRHEAGCLQNERRYKSGLTRQPTTFFTSKCTFAILLLLCLFVCFISLSAVFMLAVKVQMLEARLDELCKQTATADERDFSSKLTVPMSTEQPTFVESRNKEVMNENITEEVNGAQPPPEPVRGSRIRQGTRRISRTAGSNTGSSHAGHGNNQIQNHSFTHLTGKAQAEDIQCGRYLSWHLPEEVSYSHLSTDLLGVIANTFIRIYRPGYYYVYSQVTYHHHQTDGQTAKDVGFEMVRIPVCAPTNPTVLLRTKTTQYLRPSVYGVHNPATDSAYIGGVFHFDYLDEIAVRRSSADIIIFEPTGEELDSYNYFGAVLLTTTTPTLQQHSCSHSHLCTGL